MMEVSRDCRFTLAAIGDGIWDWPYRGNFFLVDVWIALLAKEL